MCATLRGRINILNVVCGFAEETDGPRKRSNKIRLRKPELTANRVKSEKFVVNRGSGHAKRRCDAWRERI